MLVLNRLGQEPRPVLLLLCSASLGTCGRCVPCSQFCLLPAGRDLPLPGRHCGDLGFGSRGNFSFFNSFQLMLSLGDVKRASSPSLSIIFRPSFPPAQPASPPEGDRRQRPRAPPEPRPLPKPSVTGERPQPAMAEACRGTDFPGSPFISATSGPMRSTATVPVVTRAALTTFPSALGELRAGLGRQARRVS